MPTWTMHYSFRQRFDVPAKAAYTWCTDYASDDLARMGEPGTRRVRWLADDVVVLSDRTELRGRSVRKEKLVHLMPDRMSWTSTHLAGPIRLSQFLYTIRRRGTGASSLEFTGLQVEQRSHAPTGPARAAAARALARADSATWRILARCLESDLG